MSKSKYKNPPLIETVFELRFSPPTKWGMSSYIKFATLADREGFSNVVDAGEGFQLNFAIGQDDKPPEAKRVSRRIQTWNREKTELWQASPELFAANRRSPYPGWEKFRPHILKGFELYAKTGKPKKAAALVMHYINRIEIDASKYQPADLVIFLSPEISYANSLNNFGRHTEQSFKDGDKIAVIAGSEMSGENKSGAVILNIIYTKINPGLEIAKLTLSIEKGHSRIIDAFEKSISDLQRKRMIPYD